MTWDTIASGGAMGTAGGTYKLSGTIGQVDAGPMSGGTWGLNGGFWHNFGQTPCTGDVNGDRQVTLNDLGILLAHYGQTGVTLAQGDLNGDSKVDLSDLAILLAAYGNICP